MTHNDLKALKLHDSEGLLVGDFVAAIGNPFGLEQTVTSGIVSGLSRSGLGIEGYEDFIQTDAPINPGNSGGALVDMDGHLIGINTAIVSPAGGNIGIGFAIPANMAKSVMDQLIRFGQVQRGLVGVLVQPLTPKLAKALKSPVEKGAVVTQITTNSPADKAGLKTRDVILEVNGQEIASAAQVRNVIGLLRIGSKVTFKIARAGKVSTINTQSMDPNAFAKITGSQNPRLTGLNLGQFDQQLPNRGHVKGVALINVAEDSPAWNAGLRAGDVITEINQQQTESIHDAEQLLHASNAPLLLHLLRGNGAMFVVFD